MKARKAGVAAGGWDSDWAVEIGRTGGSEEDIAVERCSGGFENGCLVERRGIKKGILFGDLLGQV